MPTPQQLEAEERRAKEEERKLKERDWRETTRSEDLSWRATVRSEDIAWRQSVRAEDLAYRQKETDWRAQGRTEDSTWRDLQLRLQSDETRRTNRRFALLAAAQSVGPGKDTGSVLQLAEEYAAWIEASKA